MRFFKDLYLSNVFFFTFGSIAVGFAVSFMIPFLFPIMQAIFVLAVVAVIIDAMLLFHPQAQIRCNRILPKVFSLNDANTVVLELYNEYALPLRISVIDELPDQFQERNFIKSLNLAAFEEKIITYALTPKTRGEYTFDAVNIFLSSFLGLLEKRDRKALTQTLPVYPSIIQMKNFELKAFSQTANLQGVKQIRRLGHSYEFEQIKNYVRGDDYRSINWKATGRRGDIMVNQYEDERSQQVYAIIDKSRVMKMPFDGLSLLDYAINTSLVITNVALKKYDRAGLLTFSDKIGTVLKAERSASQINKILQALYREKERPVEANYELLYQSARQIVKGRSLLFLFTNFESLFAAERVLPVLRKINHLHLLVVIFFENTEIVNYATQDATTVEDIYFRTVAQKFVAEKQQIVQKLQQYGIQVLLTSPHDLSLNTLNKYLELKARGLI
jgi:uncharacterized protein (DUF58 family)